MSEPIFEAMASRCNYRECLFPAWHMCPLRMKCEDVRGYDWRVYIERVMRSASESRPFCGECLATVRVMKELLARFDDDHK